MFSIIIELLIKITTGRFIVITLNSDAYPPSARDTTPDGRGISLAVFLSSLWRNTMTTNSLTSNPFWALVESARKLAHICRQEAEKNGFELQYENLGVAGDEFRVVQKEYSSSCFLNEEPAWIQCAIQNGFGSSDRQQLNDSMAVLIQYESRRNYCNRTAR
jgi:hypothetical protein